MPTEVRLVVQGNLASQVGRQGGRFLQLVRLLDHRVEPGAREVVGLVPTEERVDKEINLANLEAPGRHHQLVHRTPNHKVVMEVREAEEPVATEKMVEAGISNINLEGPGHHHQLVPIKPNHRVEQEAGEAA